MIISMGVRKSLPKDFDVVIQIGKMQRRTNIWDYFQRKQLYASDVEKSNKLNM